MKQLSGNMPQLVSGIFFKHKYYRECITMSMHMFYPGFPKIEEFTEEAERNKLQFALAKCFGDLILGYTTYNTALKAAG
jgi:hypothetical protein